MRTIFEQDDFEHVEIQRVSPGFARITVLRSTPEVECKNSNCDVRLTEVGETTVEFVITDKQMESLFGDIEQIHIKEHPPPPQ